MLVSVGTARNRIETELFNRAGICTESILVLVGDLAQRVRNDWPLMVNDEQQWSGSHVKSK